MNRKNKLRAGAAVMLLAASPVFSLATSVARPRIAVVIDDFGLTYKKNVPDDEWMKISWPVTFAVMPESPRTRLAAKQTLEHKHELIIHFPFEPFLKLKLPADKADPEDLKKLENLLIKTQDQIPGAVGFNNHQSYHATRNQPLMRFFMKKIRPRGVYFLDSKVSGKSVAYSEARKAGLAAAENFIFLEDKGRYNDKDFCVRMIRRAADRAKREGEAIAIGHHYYRGTYDCLMEEVPRLQSEGFEFVFASALAR
ncbi:MAG: hypothetical protein A3J74_09240 [Elusimicrobia bacterium RIFCSPHIGHO2_02_FULL_57_9]|nr:MAG: hypothetical protein A3J74_09240 [Elusimicrobia bacterium RIFCSPHIGHO2_02_FULL_57_9]